MAHLTEGEVEDFAAGRLDPGARSRVVSHLLHGCLACARKILTSTPLLFLEDATSDEKALEDAYDRAIDRALASVSSIETQWRQEKEKLPEALALLRQSEPRAPSLTYQQRRRLHGWPLVTALLQLSFEARYRDPRRMLWLAIEAQYVVESIEPESYGLGVVSDLSARVWAELANAFRVNEQYDEADTALQRAYQRLEEGSGDIQTS